MLNLHQLFHQSLESSCFHERLNINPQDKALLAKAKAQIRQHLRTGIAAITRQQLGAEKQVSPKFYTQGSWAYGTLNKPAHLPPQEIDLDDGTYLPMSLLNGTAPSIACDAFFKIVDTLLGDLVKENKGWKLDTSKKTCSRVHINGHSHIDVPLYAIPDSEFARLRADALRLGYESFSEALKKSAATDSWLWLASDRVWLAVRGGQWKQSDPRKVHDWFKQQVDIHGEQFLRVCRYIKAWRDQQWSDGGPSSILLMVCVSQGFKKFSGRDDMALLEVAKQLIGQLLGDVYNQFVDATEQINGLTTAERQEASAKAQTLSSFINQAVQHTEAPVLAIQLLVGQFGPRIPMRPEWVKTITRVEIVQATPKAVVAAPAIQRVRAG